MGKTERIVVVAIAAYLLLCAALTHRRTYAWVDNLSLWSSEVDGSVKPRPWINLGAALFNLHRYDEAETALAQARKYAEPRLDYVNEGRVPAITSEYNLEVLARMRGDVKLAQYHALNRMRLGFMGVMIKGDGR